MPREALPFGYIKIRQIYRKDGQSQCMVSLPSAVMEKFGWKPGEWLAYYPTTGREIVMIAAGQALTHISADFDLSSLPEPEEMKQPRSTAYYAELREREYKEMADRIRGVASKPDVEATEEDVLKDRLRQVQENRKFSERYGGRTKDDIPSEVLAKMSPDQILELEMAEEEGREPRVVKRGRGRPKEEPPAEVRRAQETAQAQAGGKRKRRLNPLRSPR